MSRTIRYGSKGDRVSLQDRLERLVLHRRTPAWFQHAIMADRLGKRIAFEVSPGQKRDFVPGPRSYLPSR